MKATSFNRVFMIVVILFITIACVTVVTEKNRIINHYPTATPIATLSAECEQICQINSQDCMKFCGDLGDLK